MRGRLPPSACDRLPVGNPDDEMGRLAAVFNATLRRLEQSFEQMRRFTADVSHQLRTPLTAIRSVGEVGLRTGHREESSYRAIIGSMLEETDRLAVLVDRLLTLSRAEMGQGTFARDTVNLTELAEDVVGHLGVLAEEKGQSLTVDATGAPTAVADRVVLRQALINLVDNAIKFTPAGGAVSIRVSGTDGTATLDVSDTGSGIPDEARDRVFDRFYRGDEDAAAGSGLGLSIAKSAVEANGGELTVARSGPQGTTFRITFPRRSSAERAVTQPTGPAWPAGQCQHLAGNVSDRPLFVLHDEVVQCRGIELRIEHRRARLARPGAFQVPASMRSSMIRMLARSLQMAMRASGMEARTSSRRAAVSMAPASSTRRMPKAA